MAITLQEIIRSITGYRKQSTKTWEGPCPRCGGNDRFIVWVNEDRFACRGCDFKGDVITWLREVEGKNCGEAFLAADRQCDSHDCDGHGKCAATREGARRAPRTDKQRKLQTPQAPEKQDDWKPVAAVTPAELWQERALKLVDEAHETLLDFYEKPWNSNATPIPGTPAEFLADRGLPFGAVVKNCLGWLDKDLYKSRSSWGLAPTKEKRGGGQTSTLWIPLGLVIPTFQAGVVHRIRIRRHKIKEGEPRYYWLEGSGDDTWILNPTARAFVVVESDLDGLLIDWHAGDLVGSIPLGSCSPRPKQNAAAILDTAVCILNSLDYEPRTNETTGRRENPGGENWLRFWKPRYPQAKRHPAPGGKDPGEAYQAGTNIRSWIIAGLPAGLRPASSAIRPEEKPVQDQPVVPPPDETEKATAEIVHQEEIPMRVIDGREIWFPTTPAEWHRLVREGKVVIGPKETKLLSEGCPALLVEKLLMAKEIFPGAFLAGIENLQLGRGELS